MFFFCFFQNLFIECSFNILQISINITKCIFFKNFNDRGESNCTIDFNHVNVFKLMIIFQTNIFSSFLMMIKNYFNQSFIKNFFDHFQFH